MMNSLSQTCARLTHRMQAIAWTGPLLVRLTLGLVFVMAGWGKLHNLENVGMFFESLGLPAPQATATFVATVEFVGGLMVMIGLGTRVMAMMLAITMAVAIWTAKRAELHGLADLAATSEFMYLVAFAWLVVAGPGKASIDHVLHTKLGGETGCAVPARA